jgi:hypothetical protein
LAYAILPSVQGISVSGGRRGRSDHEPCDAPSTGLERINESRWKQPENRALPNDHNVPDYNDDAVSDYNDNGAVNDDDDDENDNYNVNVNVDVNSAVYNHVDYDHLFDDRADDAAAATAKSAVDDNLDRDSYV